MEIPKVKVIGYVRVSTVIQMKDGHSIQSQKEQIKKYCDDKGLILKGIYQEQVSGSVNPLKRPQFLKAMNDLSNNIVSGLVLTKFDRLSRNLKDIVNLVDDYFRGKNKYKIFFVDYDHIDLSSADGELQFNVFASFAQFERRLIGNRTKKIMEYKKDKKEKLGGFIPWGYKIELVTEKGKVIKKLIENLEEKKLIEELKKIKEDEKKSYRYIAEILIERKIKNRSGKVKWLPEQVLKMLYPEKFNLVK